MTQISFPDLRPGAAWLQLAGDLTYKPWVEFDAGVMRALQQILDQIREIDGCENPDVIADWREVARGPDGGITHRSNIILYRDGGDWAEEHEGHYEAIGVLFCRQDVDQTTAPETVTYRVHIPDAAGQDTLLACCGDMIGALKQGNPEKLNSIRAYLDARINDRAAWKPLEQLLGELCLEDEGEEYL